MRFNRRKKNVKNRSVKRLSLGCVFILLVIFMLCKPRKRAHRGNHRIAIIIPYLSTSSQMLPPYFPIFLQTAKGSESIIDFLIFHNGQLSPFIDEKESTIQGFDIPDNTKFIDLTSMDKFTGYFLRVLDERMQKDSDSREHLLKIISRVLRQNPYSLVEFKPAMGHIFEEFIEEYDHWGYSDFDIAFGDLPRWITNDELENYDIVTYSYGDQNRVYLRGQFTFHKNKASINNIWRKCSYLSEMDLRFKRVLAGKEKYRLISAEGCYSNAVITTENIKVKYAVKAMSDVKDNNDNSFDYGVTIAKGTSGDRSVIYKAKQEHISSVEGFLRLSKTWFETHKEYGTHDLQWEIGEIVPIEEASKQEPGCMYWMMNEYQTDICYSGISSSETVFLANGVLYKQAFRELQLPNDITSKAFFHFQEWKRSYRTSQLLAFSRSIDDDDGGHLGWQLFQEGAASLYSTQRFEPRSRIPRTHQSIQNRGFLPSTHFCLDSSGKKNHMSPVCNYAVSWRNIATRVSKDWETLDSAGITLILTLRLDTCIHTLNDHILLNIIEKNLQWQDIPAIVLLYVSGSEERFDAAVKRMDQMLSNRSSYLVGIIYDDRDGCTSQHAVLNMAEAARRTRWIISGLEVERGFLLSRELLYFSQVAVSIYKDLSKIVFILPQIALTHEVQPATGANDETFVPLSITDILKDHTNIGRRVFTNSAELDCNKCDETNQETGIERQIDDLWIQLSRHETMGSTSTLGTYEVNSRAGALNKLQTDLTSLLNGETNVKFHHHPLLLLDMNRPDMMPGEVIDLPQECANSMRLAQLSALDYQVIVLPGAFASSTPRSQPRCFDSTVECANCNVKNVRKIMREQKVLIAKTVAFNEGIN